MLQGETQSRAAGLRVVDASPWLTVREVAERLRVSTATVYKLCARGELAHARVSNAIRVHRHDLDALVERNRS